MRSCSPFRTLLAFAGVGLATVLTPLAHGQMTSRGDGVGKLLNEWQAAGTAAGLGAITYENRDGQHSPFNVALFPQLQVFKQAPDSGPDKGPATMLRRSPTVGNCSMAASAVTGGSLPRFYQFDPNGQLFLAKQYLSNNLFIYPEHQDYDPGGNGIGGYGDLYPTNSPALLISQGSSLSDQPFVQATLSTIAAFSKETQELLIQKRFLMPTLQAIFRQSNKMVVKPEDYFTAAAHPPVFDAAQIDEEKMVRAAHAMTPDTIPPVAVVEVQEETKLEDGKHFFEAGKIAPYQLGSTPCAVTRILRGNQAEYTMLISAAKSGSVSGSPIQIRWQLLQGDPRLVSVESSGQGPYARIRVRWHPPITTATGILSHRVDLAVFAATAKAVSAPAILSFYMLPNEMHFYDAKGRVAEIWYQTHNPDLGLPTTPQDLRWIKVWYAAALKGDGLRSRLLEKLLTTEERRLLQDLWANLNPRWEQYQRLEQDPQSKDAAAKLRGELEKSVSAALGQVISSKDTRTVRTMLEKAFSAMADFSELYPSFQQELDQLASRSPKPSAAGDVHGDLQRLQDAGVILIGPRGSVSLIQPPDQLNEAERYALRGLNLTLISQVLFPEALERSSAPAWVDPRLTTPKPWRDIYRYDETTGALVGWIRRNQGRLSWFDPQGRLLPDGPKQPDKAKAVTYEKDAQGNLSFRPQ